jgi:hypothetical protein
VKDDESIGFYLRHDPKKRIPKEYWIDSVEWDEEDWPEGTWDMSEDDE